MEETPKELQDLGPLNKQLILRANSFQAFKRLGTYMGKLPSCNLLNVCKGRIFFLPFPQDNTLETMEEVQHMVNGRKTGLLDPELFIVVNSKLKVHK